MSGAFTKSMARNIFYGGTVFFFLLFLALSFDTLSQLPKRDMRARLLDCGANLVFDQRMSATQLGLVLRPYLVNKSNVHQFATRKAAPLVDQPAQRAPREQVASFG